MAWPELGLGFVPLLSSVRPNFCKIFEGHAPKFSGDTWSACGRVGCFFLALLFWVFGVVGPGFRGALSHVFLLLRF